MPNKREVSFPPLLVERLADLITAEDDAAIIRTLRAALDAELTIRAPREKGQANNYLIIEDHRVRIMAAKILAEIKHGRPRQQIEMNVSATIGGGPMSRAEAAAELMRDWESVKRIGDDHVRLLKQAMPAPPDGQPAQTADADITSCTTLRLGLRTASS